MHSNPFVHRRLAGTVRWLTAAIVAAMLCLLAVPAGYAAATPTDCTTCHGANVAAQHHDTANPNSDFNRGLCGNCHAGVTTSGDCSSCHTFTLQNNNHHIGQNGAPLNCSQCHTGGSDTGNCLTCHAGTIRPRHHQLAATGVNCSACHQGTPPQETCSGCHGVTRGVHHAIADTSNVACSSCHTGMPATPDCRGCHAAGSERDEHHAAARASGAPCASCHAGAPQVSGCADCHQGANQPSHHTSAAYVSGNCATCHATVAVAVTGCRTCHLYSSEYGDRHHAIDWTLAYGLRCIDCHVNPAKPFDGTRLDCVTCHETVLDRNGFRTTHHRMPFATTGNCTACHQAGIVSGGACNQCHGANGNPPTAQTHHATSNYTSGNCAACHAVAPVSTANCASCHTAQAPIASTHHMTIPAQLNQCGACHAGVAPATLVCANCHVTGASVPIAQRHHTSPTGLAGTCGACHNETAPAQASCALCHSSGSNHHASAQALAGNCAACHGNLQVAGENCSICHTAPIPQIHHGAPLAAVGGNCGACHQSVSDPGICANCHTSTPHHDTTWSKTGDCTHCHAVPAWAADRPAQAACRECHGTSKHDKGGPIQNYGACAACHSQEPFHPAPTSIPGYNGYGAGKRKFNIFWSQYARREGPGERIHPNGEEMNDEGGLKIKAQQLSFSTKQISHNGRNYTVPYFTGMASSNLALNKSATATRAESGYAASLAVDGNAATRWWAKSTSTQSLTVDLGATRKVGKVNIRWHSYYATGYEVRVSTNNSTWTKVAGTTTGNGGLAEWSFAARDARYVQIYSTRAASYNGYSIFEVEVFAP